MLFDLRGRRRRAVQATYLTLAVLMGGGLVLFGIGGDVSGGLFDAFSERGGGGGSVVKDRVESAEERVERNPRDGRALGELVRGYFQLAADETPENATSYSENARDELEKSGAAWDRYLALDLERTDPALANIASQVYGREGLNRPEKAVVAAELLAEARPSANAYLQLTEYAAKAGQDRKADLAGEQAIRLAPKAQRSSVRDFVKQAKAGDAAAQQSPAPPAQP